MDIGIYKSEITSFQFYKSPLLLLNTVIHIHKILTRYIYVGHYKRSNRSLILNRMFLRKKKQITCMNRNNTDIGMIQK